MKTFTIGFTKKNAETFFEFIRDNNVVRLLDVRLNNVSQLAGFAKRDDLRFFLKELCGTEYLHVPNFAPTKEILDAYKKDSMPWSVYEDKFLNLMAQRNVERDIDPSMLERSCLLCSEHEPHYCHRRLVLQYLNDQWGSSIEVQHLY